MLDPDDTAFFQERTGTDAATAVTCMALAVEKSGRMIIRNKGSCGSAMEPAERLKLLLVALDMLVGLVGTHKVAPPPDWFWLLGLQPRRLYLAEGFTYRVIGFADDVQRERLIAEELGVGPRLRTIRETLVRRSALIEQ